MGTDFSGKEITKDDLIKSYTDSIESKKRSVQYWIDNPSKDSKRRIEILESSIKEYQRYIKELNK